MAKINFDALKTVDDWSGALDTLIAEGKAATRDNDSDKRLDVQAQLTDFITRSPSFAAPLDEVARAAARDLFIEQVDASLAALALRDADLKKATELLKGVAAKADADAKSIQFKKVIDILDRSKAALDELKKLEETLAAPNLDLLRKIKAANASIEEVMKAVTKPA